MIQIDKHIGDEPVTHYSKLFDENGRPYAVPADSPDIAGELPRGWDSIVWDWHPRHDPAGAWVPLVDLRRAILWDEVKAKARDIAEQGIPTSKGVLDGDEVSMNKLARRVSAGVKPGEMWTLKNNTRVPMSPTDLRTMLADAESYLDRIHSWTQTIRSLIYDPANDTLEKLDAIDLTPSL